VNVAIATRQAGRITTRTRFRQDLLSAEREVLAELDLVRASLRPMSGMAEARTGASDLRPTREMAEPAREAIRRHGRMHERLLSLIACHAPVAGDLRLAVALLRVNDGVRRMAARCLELCALLAAVPAAGELPAGQLECFVKMAALVDEQLAEARRTFAARDVQGAQRLRERDRQINERNRRCFLLAAQADRDADPQSTFSVTLMARALERIGDNAVTIASQTEPGPSDAPAAARS
jgi:phosphate transport system protein